MLFLGKVKDAFTGEVDTWKIDACSGADAQSVFIRMLIEKKPFHYAVCDHWVEPADEQSDEDKTFAVFCYDHRTGMAQNNYPDTWEEAAELADAMSNFYDDVEICYGWPGHWQHADQEDTEVGSRLYSYYYQEANA